MSQDSFLRLETASSTASKALRWSLKVGSPVTQPCDCKCLQPMCLAPRMTMQRWKSLNKPANIANCLLIIHGMKKCMLLPFLVAQKNTREMERLEETENHLVRAGITLSFSHLHPQGCQILKRISGEEAHSNGTYQVPHILRYIFCWKRWISSHHFIGAKG